MQNNCMNVDIDVRTGGISSLSFVGDPSGLNWVDGDKTHGAPYGAYSVISVGQTSENECGAIYTYKGLELKVMRKLTEHGLINRYVFNNNTDASMEFRKGDLGITMPFNDNYESADICLDKKCHMHIWCGENSSYVACKRMNGRGDNLGAVLARGSIAGYAINRAWNSNDRGDLSMLLPSCIIPAGGSINIEFILFKYNTFQEFYNKIVECPNCLSITADKYAVAVGEKINVDLITKSKSEINSNYGNITTTDFGAKLELTFDEIGEKKLVVNYGDGLSTHADFYVYESVMGSIDSRLKFIINNQLIRVKGRFKGAVMLYDNERESTFVENRSVNDRNFGRERMCMMTSLVERLMRGGLDENTKSEYDEALKIGTHFIDKMLVRDNGQVYEVPIYQRNIFVNRLYNYSWAMLFFISVYEYTGDKKYLTKACNIARVYYKKGGEKFYAILLPLSRIVDDCIKSQYISLADEMKGLFLKHGDRVIEIGINYPPHEVKYEQSIVAPSIDILLECYKISQDRKYLDEAERQLPLLEAFNGEQPSFHNNQVAIRHWDGFWFGKKKMYGDTFPHYWSCISAMVFSKYSTITGNLKYQEKADICLRNNLSLISGGRGSCAYIMPMFINGKSGEYYDPWANDQDWLLWFNMMFNSELNKN